MKNIFTLLIFAILASCQSKEHKASKLIKEDMYKTLYDFASYEPIETIIDSAYTSIYRDSSILIKAHMMEGYYEKYKEYLKEAENASSSVEVWSDSYSSYGRSKYKDALDKALENYEKSKTSLEDVIKYGKLLKSDAASFKKTFIGWQAKHKFRCKTKGGHSDLANYIYVFDNEINKIIYSENMDDEKLIKIKNRIDEVILSDINQQ